MQLSQTQSLGSQWVYSWKHPVPVRFSVRLPLTCALCTRSPRPRFLPRLDFVSCHSCQTIRWDPCYAIYSLRFHSIRRNGDERSDASIGSFLIWNRFPNFNATTRWKRREYSINNNSISTFPSPRSKLWARVDRWKSANWLTNPIRPAIGILGNE